MMESIYPPERFKATENVILSKYLREFTDATTTDLFASSKPHKYEDEAQMKEMDMLNMKNVMGIDISPTQLTSLEKECSVDLLLCDGEVKRRPIKKPQKYTLRAMIFDGLPFTEKCLDLEVLKKKAEIEKIRSCEKLLLLNKENFHNSVIEDDNDKSLPKDLTPGCDFVMNIFLYKPFSYNFQTKNYSEKFRFSQEIQVLGRNTLTEFRDKITCTTDSGLQAEVESPKSDMSDLFKAKEKYPSGAFFIDGVFYNDMRSPNATDYSEVVIQWAKMKQVGLMQSADMHLTRVADLSPRFGYPYLYLHQGECEHIMVFGDAHILTENDCLNSQQYPRMYAMNRNTSIMCYMCNVSAARWLVKDYDRLPQSSTFLCTKCTQSYCYKDDEKIGEFKLYPLFNKFLDSFAAGDNSA